jgi:O-antigen ligase
MVMFPSQIGFSIVGMVLLFGIRLIKKQISFTWGIPQVLMVLLYLIYFVGVFYTKYPEIASKTLEYKASLILFPLIIGTLKVKTNDLKFPFLAFLLGVFVATIIGAIQAYDCYIINGDINCLLSVRFSPIHHPSYFSAFCFIGLLFLWNKALKTNNSLLTALKVFLSIFLIVTTFLCASLAGISFMLLFGVVFMMRYLFNRFGLTVFAITAVLIGYGVFGILNLDFIESQIITSKLNVDEFVDSPESYLCSRNTYIGGTEARLILWKVSTDLLLEYPGGQGTGNVDYALMVRLKEYDQNQLIAQNLNPHNQFLQTGIETGWIGLGVFILLLGSTVFYGFKYKSVVLVFLGVNAAYNCLVESMFQRQSGIVFYCFFICLLMVAFMNRRNQEKRLKVTVNAEGLEEENDDKRNISTVGKE